MPLSWNEIKDRALAFSKEWADEKSEDAEAKSFWDSFFNVFGITRRRVASFEEPVKKGNSSQGYIDLLWKGVLLVEHKSRGKNLDRAVTQAFDYFPGLKERDLPRYVLVSDFARFRLYDLDEDKTHEISLEDLHKNVNLFGFIAGYQVRSFGQEDPVNIKAAERLGELHDLLLENGYKGHALEVFLVRLLFCLFAEDTGIFQRRLFQDYIELRTNEDGSDLGMHLMMLYQALDRETDARQKNLDEQLAAFPYVNGRLFAESLPIPSFNRKMRESLLECCALDWSRISPAIFGSLFQSIMDKKTRRNLGAHYTTETNIRKALDPLFLDELRAEFEKSRRDNNRMKALHKRLSTIRILDPGCGCGNFLVIAYRELRLLELDILRERYKKRDSGFLSIGDIVFVDVDQFYGIEIEEFPAQIAQVAIWLMDHQMNMRVSEEFGQYFVRLPLTKSPTIVNSNAVTLNWESVLPASQLSYIVGNPPFVGKYLQTKEQKKEIEELFNGVKGYGLLDYVSCWYLKTLELMHLNRRINAALVSTNSITQGEQVAALWPILIEKGISIRFAHRTFLWTSEARGAASVHCVIIGFSLDTTEKKYIFEYDNVKSSPHVIESKIGINPYLVDAENIILQNRRKPICKTVDIVFGSMPNDGGHLLLSDNDKIELIKKDPGIDIFIRQFVGATDYINGGKRWCIWLKDMEPRHYRNNKIIIDRIEKVRKYRENSSREATRKLANTPYLFGEIRQPANKYLLLPRHSSENRKFIPIGFMDPSIIAGDSCMIIPNATLYDFGIITSTMHMAWVRSVCGRIKSDYRYSAGIVYNNYPWPKPSEEKRKNVGDAANEVLESRAKYPESTLADLYDPLTMPADLTKAHQALDHAVDAAYGKTTFKTEAERVAHLFKLYQETISKQSELSLGTEKASTKKKREY